MALNNLWVLAASAMHVSALLWLNVSEWVFSVALFYSSSQRTVIIPADPGLFLSPCFFLFRI